MQKTAPETLDSNGFTLIDFLIIGGVIAVLAFIVISNILAHAY